MCVCVREKEIGTVCKEKGLCVEKERERERAKIVRSSVCVEIEIGSV